MNLGDLYNNLEDRFETYFDITRMGVILPKRKAIVRPPEPCEPVEIPPIPGLTESERRIARAILEGSRKLFESCYTERIWQLLMDLWVKLQLGMYFVKNPNWVEPPVTAIPLDIRNDLGTAVTVEPPFPPVENDTVLASFTVPDRMRGVILRYGNELDPPSAFPNTLFRILVNGKPVKPYGTIQAQIGRYVDPTWLGSHILLKHKDVVTLTATTTVPGVTAFARAMGFLFPVQKTSQDGTFMDFRTL